MRTTPYYTDHQDEQRPFYKIEMVFYSFDIAAQYCNRNNNTNAEKK